MQGGGERGAPNHARVIAMAAKLFAERGFELAGVNDIMAAAGLTRGGFYRPFRSKEDLAVQALSHGLAAWRARMEAHDSLAGYVAAYLSPGHRDDPGAGCLVAALAGDVARQGDNLRGRLTGDVALTLARLEGLKGGENADQAVLALSAMVGALVLSRAINDPELSDAILASARDALNAVVGPGAGPEG